jgi:hypothetical protein
MVFLDGNFAVGCGPGMITLKYVYRVIKNSAPDGYNIKKHAKIL